MTDYETASLALAQAGFWVALASAIGAVISAAAAAVAAIGIWRFGKAMEHANAARAAQAAQDSQVTQGMLAALQELIRRTSPPQAGPAE